MNAPESATRARTGAPQDEPLVSVIVRSMDRPTLAQALASLAAQTYPNLEVLVVNAKGGLHSPLPDCGVRLAVRVIATGAPMSRSRAANAGLDAARGDYVALLDDDDTLDPEHFGHLVARLREEGDGAVVYAGVRCMNRDDPERKVSRIFAEPFESRAKLIAGNFIPSHAVLFPRRLLESGARFDETLEVYEDWDFWLQLAERARFVYADRVSATYFTGGTSDVSPLAFDPEAVRRAARTLFAKWRERISPDEFKALGDLYHRSREDLRNAREEARWLASEVSRLGNELGRLESEVRERDAQLKQLEDQVDGFESELGRKEREVAIFLERLAAAESSLAAVLASRSWRLTHPLRAFSTSCRRAAHRAARAAYRLYAASPLALRERLRPLVRPLAARLGLRGPLVAASTCGSPVDYVHAIAGLERDTPALLAFPSAATPAMSIIVIDRGHPRRTQRALSTLRRESGIEGCEVILVTAEPAAWTAQTKGVRVEACPPALDVEARAHGAALARAPWLLFLSGNGCLLPGALAEARRLIDDQPDLALAAPKVLAEDAQLAYAIGETQTTDPNAPEVNFVRPAERCPAAAFLLNSSFLGAPEWLRSDNGGWMTALAGAIRSRGGRILYAPGMHAVVPAGTLATISTAGSASGDLQRVLVIDVHTPTPDVDSGSVDAYFQMKVLGELGYRVTFAPAANLDYRPRYTADLQRIGVECLYRPHTGSIADHLREHGSRYRFVILSRLPAAAEFIDQVKRECPGAGVVFNTVDLHFLREAREAALSRDRNKARLARRTQRRELAVMRKADATWVISEAEAALVREQAPGVRTFHLPLIMQIRDRAQTPFRERKDLFFIGGFRHLPNADAVRHFVADIWPHIRERLPGTRFHVVGGEPPPDILALAAPDIVVAGHVPDAAPYFNGCRLSVAPLRFGAGLKGKVGRSFGYGCPVVMTPLAAEGMTLTGALEAMVAQDAERFADAVVRVYQDEALWHALSRECAEFFAAHYSLEVGRARIATIFEALAAGAG
jgi:glycosyltransferase involved in cell wall biosynthesis